MLDDRPYMRSGYRPPRAPFRLTFSATNVLVGLLIVAFFIQNYHSATYPGINLDYFTLSWQGLAHGYVWQLLTFQFLHAGISHLVFNGIALWSFGRFVEERLGKAHFLTLYFMSGVTGGLLQCLMGFLLPTMCGGPTIGASAGIFGVVAAFALLEPDAPVLLFFFVPMRAINLLYLSIAFSVVLFFVHSSVPVAHAAHLGGIAFGVFYIRRGLGWMRGLTGWSPAQRRTGHQEMWRATAPKPVKPRRPKPAEPADVPSGEFISQEVDPILDKISAHGIQSLTERERQILQAARSKMSRR
jgi:membrane associated rhomboid family serine protease